MKILVINSGSSSVKFKLFDMASSSVIAEGNCQRVGLTGSEIKYEWNGTKKKLVEDLSDHTAALARIFKMLTEGETRVLGGMEELDAIGHRFTIGGFDTPQSFLINDETLAATEQVQDVTPLHLPPQIKGVRVCRELLGDKLPMVAGLDVAFHTTMPRESFLYAIPYHYYEKYNIRKYGFHGLSHQFVVERYSELTGKALEGTRIVTCHLGGGSSVTAVLDGKSVDNSFGFGTGEGPGCGTRAGTVDHVMIGYMMEKEGLSYVEVEDVLHRESGLLGISGISSDEKELEDLAAEGNERAQLALDIMARQIKKYIGSYAFAMGGLDAVIFTGGIGENSDIMRAMITSGLEEFGVELDETANVELNRKEAKISRACSKVELWTIPTNEELMIARETERIVLGNTAQISEKPIANPVLL